MLIILYLNEYVDHPNSKLEDMTKRVRMMYFGTKTLEKLYILVSYPTLKHIYCTC